MVAEAHVRDAFVSNAIEVWMLNRFELRTLLVSSLGEGQLPQMREVDEGRNDAHGLLIRRDFAEPLRDALDVFLGKPREDWRSKYEEARDALAVERRRVDELLAGYAARNP